MNFWDERYAGEEFFYGNEPNDFLKDQFRHIPFGGRVLCLAEGEGRNAVFLATQGYQVTAVDGSQEGLKKLKRLAAERKVKVETHHADLVDFAIEPESWDGIVSIWCHLPRPLRQKVHQASVRGLKQGGVFILEAYRPEQLRFKTGGPSDEQMLMPMIHLKEESADLRLEMIREIEREVREGKGHQGPSAVVQVVARKG